MELEPLNLDSIQTQQPVQPAVQFIAAEPVARADRRNWIIVALLSVVAFLAFALLSDRGIIPGPSPEPSPDIDISGKYVLFLVDESKLDSVTEAQGQVLASAKVQTWCEEAGIKYRRMDSRDDFSKVEPIWRQLADVAGSLPAMTTLADGKVKTQAVPSSVDAAIKAIEEATK